MEKIGELSFCVLLAIIVLFSGTHMIGNEINVNGEDTRSSTLYVGQDQLYKTINSAIKAAGNGDTIRVYSGIYYESMTISKSITLEGNSSKTSVINHTATSTIIWITANDVTIKNMGFEGNSLLESIGIKANGLNTTGGNRIKVAKCEFTNTKAISIGFSNGHRIMDNIIQNGKCGSFSNTADTILKNNLGLNGGAIFIEGDNNIVENCTASNFGKQGTGIGVDILGEGNIVRECFLHDINGTGIRISGNDNRIDGNIIESNLWNGMYIYVSDRLIISNNTFKDNLLNGLRIIGSDNCSIRYNDFINSEDYGILIEHSGWNTADNEIIFNNFIGNGGDYHQAFDYYEGNIWSSPAGGNYWSDHNNIDWDKDGFADSPYTINGQGDAKDYKPFPSQLEFLNPVELVTKDVTSVNRSENYSVQYKAYDWDSTKLTWSMETNASFLSFSSSQVLYGTPQVPTSSYWVNITVRDEQSMDFSNFTLKVIDPNPPLQIITVNVPTCTEDEDYIVQYQAYNGADLTWELATDAGFLSMDPSTGVLSGIPGNDDVGSFNVLISAKNDRARDESEFTLEVINTNDRPEIMTNDILSVKEGELYSVQYLAIDIDPTMDELYWSLVSDCSFINMDGYTGILSGIPEQDDAGVYDVNVTVSDGNGGFDSHIFKLEVLRVNIPPVASKEKWNIEMMEDGTDSSLNIFEMFYDIDGDFLDHEISSHDDISSQISDSGTITFRPSPDWNGKAIFTASASDGEFTASTIIEISVLNVNDAPSKLEIMVISEEFRENNSQKVSASALDIDTGDSLTYEWIVEGIGIIGTGNSTDLDLPAGNYTLILRVIDTFGDDSETSIRIMVLPVSDVIPHDDDPSNAGSFLFLFITGCVFTVLLVIITLSFFIYRRRKSKIEERNQAFEVWNPVIFDNNGPTPLIGKVLDPLSVSDTHILHPDQDLAVNNDLVNGGKLDDNQSTDDFPGKIDLHEDRGYLFSLFNEVIEGRKNTPSNIRLLDRLENARMKREIPEKDYSEIKRKLNNMNKYDKIK